MELSVEDLIARINLLEHQHDSLIKISRYIDDVYRELAAARIAENKSLRDENNRLKENNDALLNLINNNH